MGPEELTPEQKLKGSLIFKYLKTGKIPKRKGLFRTLFYLAKESRNFKKVMMTSSSVTLKRPSIDRTVQISILKNTNIANLENIFKKYLVNFDIKYHKYNLNIMHLTVYYSSNDVQWALIDEELRTNHSNNISKTDGFPKIINHIRYEQK
jgi:hypothetical protein